MRQQKDPSRLLLLLKPECWQLSQALLQEGVPDPYSQAVSVFQTEFAVYEDMDAKPDELQRLRPRFSEEQLYHPTESQVRELAVRVSSFNPQLLDLYQYYYLIGGPLPVVCRKQLLERVSQLNKKDNISHSSTAISRTNSQRHQQKDKPCIEYLLLLLGFCEPIPKTNSVLVLLRQTGTRSYHSVRIQGLQFLLVISKFDSLDELKRFVVSQRRLQEVGSPFIVPLFYYDIQKIDSLEIGFAYRLACPLEQTLLTVGEEQKTEAVAQLLSLVSTLHEYNLCNIRLNQEEIFFCEGRVCLFGLRVGEPGDYLDIVQQAAALDQRYFWDSVDERHQDGRANDWAELARVCGSLLGEQQVSSFQMARLMVRGRPAGRGPRSPLERKMHDLIEMSIKSL